MTKDTVGPPAADGAAAEGEAPDEGVFAGYKHALTGEWDALVDDARGAIGAEITFRKAQAGAAGKAVGWIVGMVVLALVLLFFLLMALIVGLLLALAKALGTWGALAAVMGGIVLTIVLAGLGALLGVRRLKRILAIGKEGQP